MCPFTVTFKCSRTKYLQMAADPRKPQTLINPVKIKAHTVVTVDRYQYMDIVMDMGISDDNVCTGVDTGSTMGIVSTTRCE